MAKKVQSRNPFTGRWRIVSMSAWEDEYLDEEVQAFFEGDDSEFVAKRAKEKKATKRK